MIDDAKHMDHNNAYYFIIFQTEKGNVCCRTGVGRLTTYYLRASCNGEVVAAVECPLVLYRSCYPPLLDLKYGLVAGWLNRLFSELLPVVELKHTTGLSLRVHSTLWGVLEEDTLNYRLRESSSHFLTPL